MATSKAQTDQHRERCAKALKLQAAGVDRHDIAERMGVRVAQVDKMLHSARRQNRVPEVKESAEI